jgi:alkaline phosphatase D
MEANEVTRAASPQVDRRTVLQWGAAAGFLFLDDELPLDLGLTPAEIEALFSVDAALPPQGAFPLSVAAGDPRPNGAVLWTRLAPQSGPARVAVQVAEDAAFSRVLARGVVTTDAARDWTVKVQASSSKLRPHTTYHYRFIFNKTASRPGRFKTLPAPDAPVERLRFAFISCQDYTNGYYTALRHLAAEDVDFVVHLGDYIYETVRDVSFQAGQVRPIALPSGRDRAEDLADYRFLYRTYRSDEDLQRVHERFAFISIWDDHEFANDCYREYDTDSTDEAANRAAQRRQDANRAWSEYIPAGVEFDPARDPLSSLRIYRSFQFGTLLELALTDERLYRDGPPCGLATQDRYLTPGCPERTNPARSMLGGAQRQWLLDTLTRSSRTWKIWGNQVMVMQFKFTRDHVASLFPALPGAGRSDVFFTIDAWDGYPAERAQLLRALRAAGTRNVVTITGDIHTFIAGYQKEDFEDPQSPPVAPCFVAGSVTSSNFNEIVTLGLGGQRMPPLAELTAAARTSNPHMEYLNSSGHGYNLVEVSPEALVCTMKSVDTVRQPQANLYTLKVFRVPRDRVVIQDVTGRAA